MLFLTQGVNSKYESYRDPRCWSVPNGSRFVDMAEILGMNVMAEDLLRDPDQVRLVKERGQILFSWTDDRNDKETVTYLKRLGVNGIVYDRMDVNSSKEVKESIFLTEKRLLESGETASTCSSCGSSSSSSAGENKSEGEEESGEQTAPAAAEPIISP